MNASRTLPSFRPPGQSTIPPGQFQACQPRRQHLAAFTIIDIFTHDRTGLLYAITRTLFELGLSVGRAKIGTFLDQVVDVFYVTDQQDRKIRDERQLAEIRRRLLESVEGDPVRQ